MQYGFEVLLNMASHLYPQDALAIGYAAACISGTPFGVQGKPDEEILRGVAGKKSALPTLCG